MSSSSSRRTTLAATYYVVGGGLKVVLHSFSLHLLSLTFCALALAHLCWQADALEEVSTTRTTLPGSQTGQPSSQVALPKLELAKTRYDLDLQATYQTITESSLNSLPRSTDVCSALTGNVCAFMESSRLLHYVKWRVQQVRNANDFETLAKDWENKTSTRFRSAFYFHARICSSQLRRCVVSGDGYGLEDQAAANMTSNGVTWFDHLNVYMSDVVNVSAAARDVTKSVASGIAFQLNTAADKALLKCATNDTACVPLKWERVVFAGCRHLPNFGRALSACREVREDYSGDHVEELYPGLVVSSLMQVTPLTARSPFFNWPPLWAYGGNDTAVAQAMRKDDLLYAVSGFMDSSTRAITPCDSSYSHFCSQHNLLYLAGLAYRELHSASDFQVLVSMAVEISYGPRFKVKSISVDGVPNDFYIFFIRDDGTIIAHEYEDYINRKLSDVHESARASNLHELLLEAAGKNDNYGSFVTYKWPRDASCLSDCSGATWEDQKVAYVFRYDRFDVSGYVGVGYNHERPPVAKLDTRSQDVVNCTDLYALPCSAVNAENLVSHTKSAILIYGLDRVMAEIDAKNQDYLIESDDGLSYVFIADYNMTMLAHGSNPGQIVGRTLAQFAEIDPVLSKNICDYGTANASVGCFDGDLTQDRMRRVAEAGGGWVTYTWVDSDGNSFEKISFIRGFNEMNGRFVYIGSGYNQRSYPVAKPIANPPDVTEEEARCSADYETECSRKEVISLVGYKISELNSAISVDLLSDRRTYGLSPNFAQALKTIMQDEQNEELRSRNFHISVFDLDGALQASDEISLQQPTRTWGDLYLTLKIGDILKEEGVTSLNSNQYAEGMIAQSYLGGGWLEESAYLLDDRMGRSAWVVYVSAPICSNIEDLSTCVFLTSHVSHEAVPAPQSSCELGHYLSADNNCVPCQPGYFQDNDNSTQCDPCDVDSYAPSAGSATCTSCPLNSRSLTRASVNLTECECRENYFNANSSKGQPCTSCPSNGQCMGGTNLPYASKGSWGSEACPFAFAQCPGDDAYCLGEFRCEVGHSGRFCQRCSHGYGRAFVDAGKCLPCEEPHLQRFKYIGSCMVLALFGWLTVHTDLAGTHQVKPVYSQIIKVAISYYQVVSLVVQSGVQWPSVISVFGEVFHTASGGGASSIATSECLFDGVPWVNDTSTRHGVLGEPHDSPRMLKKMYGFYLDLMAPLFALLLTFILVLAEQIYMTLRVRFRKMPIDNVGFPRALIFADKRAEDMTSSDLDEAVESGELDCTAFGLSIVGIISWFFRMIPKVTAALAYVAWPNTLTIALSGLAARPVDSRIVSNQGDSCDSSASPRSSITFLWNADQDDVYLDADGGYYAILPATIALGFIILYPLAIGIYLRRNQVKVILRDTDLDFSLGFLYRDYSNQLYWWELVSLTTKLFLAFAVTIVKPFGPIYSILMLLGACFASSILVSVYVPFTMPIVNSVARYASYAAFTTMYLSLFFGLDQYVGTVASVLLIVIQVVMFFAICVTTIHTFLSAHLAKLVVQTGEGGTITPETIVDYFTHEFGGIMGKVVSYVFIPYVSVRHREKKLHRENSVAHNIVYSVTSGFINTVTRFGNSILRSALHEPPEANEMRRMQTGIQRASSSTPATATTHRTFPDLTPHSVAMATSTAILRKPTRYVSFEGFHNWKNDAHPHGLHELHHEKSRRIAFQEGTVMSFTPRDLSAFSDEETPRSPVLNQGDDPLNGNKAEEDSSEKYRSNAIHPLPPVPEEKKDTSTLPP